MRSFCFCLLMLFSCDSALQTNNEMRQDVAKVVGYFCKSQKKQIEISQKLTAYKEKGQLPGDELDKEMEEANKQMENYSNSLQTLMEKYKGQERTVHGLLKEGQLNCK